MSNPSASQFTWNQTRRDYPHSSSIAEVFAAQARRRGNAAAVEINGQGLAYRELNQRSNQLARYMQQLGITTECLVGICLDRSLSMIVGLLGILKAGAAYVPLDPSYPRERLAYMLKDSGVRIVLTEQKMLDLLPHDDNVRFVCVDGEAEAIERFSKRAPGNAANGRSLAYVMYTSGSTGKPKGVAVEQRSVMRLVRNSNYVNLSPWEVILQFAPVSFDAATFEIWGALLNGARLVLAPPVPPSLEHLGTLIREKQITTLWLTASLFHAMVEERLQDLKDVNQLLAGGDVLVPQCAQKASRTLRNGVLINGYGPTENTTFTCCFAVRDLDRIALTVPIGTPVANTQAWVLDEDMDPVPVGVAGELYAGGDGLARGYLNRPDLTAEKFVPDCCSGEAGARLYRTGDRARWLPDGNLEFLGRKDNQVKIRGFRIELGEIEAVLNQHPYVRASAVTVCQQHSGEKRLVAYIVSASAHLKITKELQRYLALELPEYMMPSQFVFLERLPLSPVGKVDRVALPLPESPGANLLPQTEVESQLASACAEALGLSSVPLDASFLELGGSSLNATRVAAALLQSSLEVPIAELLSGKTIQEMARACEASALSAPPVFRKVPRIGPLPAAFSQERIWFVYQIDRDNLAYHFHAKIVFLGGLNIPALENALARIVERHEIYRTTYFEDDGQLFQKIHAPWPVHLDVVDLQQQSTTGEEVFRQESRKLFDLGMLPLVRWKLVRHSPGEHTLLISEHHVIHDGWSFNVFLKELTELYRAATEDYVPEVCGEPLQFADFVCWQREWMNREEAREQLDFWTRTLAGAPPLLSLPLDRPRPAVQTYKGAAPRIDVSKELESMFPAAVYRNRTTLFGLFMAAFQILLFKYSGQDDFLVGTGIANRRWVQTRDLIGMLVNNVVLRTQITSRLSVGEVIENLRQTTLSVYDNQDLPFDKVVQACHPARDLSYNPLFQVALSFHDSPVDCALLPGLHLKVDQGLSNGSAKFDLNVIMMPPQSHNLPPGHKPSRIMMWEYNTDLFDPETIHRIMAHYRRVLEAVVRDGAQKISDISLLDETERRQILVEWNQTAAPFPSEKCIHQLFEEQVEKTPSALAVASAGRTLTYAELNAGANQLASYLRKSGVGPESPVGICMERSPDLVLAMIAVLKAGGAYVPMDVTCPALRLRYIAENSQIRIVLTHSHVRHVLGNPQVQEICLDRDYDKIIRQNAENLATSISPENLAYVIFTSGSTGMPKGVAVVHRGVTNLAAWHKNFYGTGPSDRIPHLAAWAFDASVLELWPALLSGACVEVPGAELLESLPSLFDWFKDRGITLAFLPAPVASILNPASLPAGLRLREVLTGGDRLPQGSWSSLPFPLTNNYGPTENTVVTACARAQSGKLPPIGRPLANNCVYVLDDEFQPVLIGVAGELFVGGKSLARGYINRPDLTAERFVPDPFSARPGERLYRTGDIVRYTTNGVLEFIGRGDHQVKLRGYRIELGEIEAAVRAHPSVEQASVVLHENAQGEKRLIAYVVSKTPDDPLEDAVLRAFLLERLPAYMVPAVFVQLKELPVTSNGKVDRKGLPAAEYRVEQHRAPRNPQEETLCGIFAEVLSLERVSIDDDFFGLGGHSLMAMRVISRVRAALGLELTVRTMFEAPTVANLSARFASNPPDVIHAVRYAKPAAVKRS